MKKFIKKLFALSLILCILGYIYVNKDKAKEMATTIEIYTKAVTLTEYEYTEQFKINDIKVNTNNFYYKKLNENQKSIYKSLANGIKELENEIILKNYEYTDNQTSLSDIELVFNYFCLDHPEVFYLNNNYTVSTISSIIVNKVVIEVNYSVENIEELNFKVDKINGVIDSYLKEVKNKGTFESEIILHDNLARNVKYYEHEEIEDIPNTCHTIEGAFLNNEAVCDGLSKAIQVLLSNIDIKNIVVIGELGQSPHAWNMVKLEDTWYNLDITSNKSIKLEDGNSIVMHVYFNVDDDFIADTHEFNDKDILPISSNLNDRYNYYIYTNKYIKYTDNFKTKLSRIILDNTDEYILEFYAENINKVPNNIYDTILFTGKGEYLNGSEFKYYNISNIFIIVKNKLSSY